MQTVLQSNPILLNLPVVWLLAISSSN